MDTGLGTQEARVASGLKWGKGCWPDLSMETQGCWNDVL